MKETSIAKIPPLDAHSAWGDPIQCKRLSVSSTQPNQTQNPSSKEQLGPISTLDFITSHNSDTEIEGIENHGIVGWSVQPLNSTTFAPLPARTIKRDPKGSAMQKRKISKAFSITNTGKELNSFVDKLLTQTNQDTNEVLDKSDRRVKFNVMGSNIINNPTPQVAQEDNYRSIPRAVVDLDGLPFNK